MEIDTLAGRRGTIQRFLSLDRDPECRHHHIAVCLCDATSARIVEVAPLIDPEPAIPPTLRSSAKSLSLALCTARSSFVVKVFFLKG
jgi:hypothetical protein